MNENMGKRLYCIIRAPKTFELEWDFPLSLVSYKKLAAVVSDAPIKEYKISSEDLFSHQCVIETIMKKYSPVMPVSFGIVAGSGKNIQEQLLKPREEELLNALNGIKGKVGLGLKALWLDMPRIFQKVVEENPELKKIKQATASGKIGRNAALEAGKLVAEGLEKRRKTIKEEILGTLKGFFLEYKELPVFGEQMVFNLAFLIPENKQRAFDKAAKDLDKKYQDEAVYFKYVGPLPLFDFVPRISMEI